MPESRCRRGCPRHSWRQETRPLGLHTQRKSRSSEALERNCGSQEGCRLEQRELGWGQAPGRHSREEPCQRNGGARLSPASGPAPAEALRSSRGARGQRLTAGVASAPCSPSAAHLRCRPGLKLHQKQTRPQTARLEREFKHKGQENGNRLSVLFQGGPRTVFHTRSRLWRGVRKAGPAGAAGRHREGSPRHSAAAVGVLAPPTSAVSRLQQLAGEGFQKGARPGGLRPPFLLGTAGLP